MNIQFELLSCLLNQVPQGISYLTLQDFFDAVDENHKRIAEEVNGLKNNGFLIPLETPQKYFIAKDTEQIQKSILAIEMKPERKQNPDLDDCLASDIMKMTFSDSPEKKEEKDLSDLPEEDEEEEKQNTKGISRQALRLILSHLEIDDQEDESDDPKSKKLFEKFQNAFALVEDEEKVHIEIRYPLFDFREKIFLYGIERRILSDNGATISYLKEKMGKKAGKKVRKLIRHFHPVRLERGALVIPIRSCNLVYEITILLHCMACAEKMCEDKI